MTDQARPDSERTVVREPRPPVETPTAPQREMQAVPQTESATVVAVTPDRPRWYRRIWSNLNLNGSVPARVRPAIGEWGPLGLPSTKQKKRARWLAPVIFAVVLIALVLLGWFFWTAFR